MDIGAIFAILFGFLVYIGPLGVMTLIAFLNIRKGNWSWNQVIVGAIVGLLIAASVPGLGKAMNDGMNEAFTSISNSK